ncbi:MAG: hypothetical protein AAGD14_03750 [Planctomycetota bacterium]
MQRWQWGALLLLLAGVVGFVVHARHFVAHEREAYEATIAQGRARGLRLALEDWNLGSPPDSQNSFAEVERELDEMASRGLAGESLGFEIEEDGRAPPGEWAKAAAWIDKLDPTIESLQLLSRRRFMDGSARQGIPYVWEHPEALACLGIADLSEWRIRVAEHRNEPSTVALSTIESLLRFAGQLPRVPMFLHLVSCSMAGGGASHLPRMSRMSGFDPAVARQRLDPLLRSLLDPEPFLEALEFEAASLTSILQGLIDGDLPGDLVESLVPGRGIDLREMGRVYRSARASVEDIVHAGERIRAVGPGRYYAESVDRLDTTMMNGLGLPAVRYVASRMRTTTELRQARLFLALHVHKQQHSEFPASLDELAPLFPDGIPLDPFTDQPFVYERGVKITGGEPPREFPLR